MQRSLICSITALALLVPCRALAKERVMTTSAQRLGVAKTLARRSGLDRLLKLKRISHEKTSSTLGSVTDLSGMLHLANMSAVRFAKEADRVVVSGTGKRTKVSFFKTGELIAEAKASPNHLHINHRRQNETIHVKHEPGKNRRNIRVEIRTGASGLLALSETIRYEKNRIASVEGQAQMKLDGPAAIKHTKLYTVLPNGKIEEDAYEEALLKYGP